MTVNDKNFNLPEYLDKWREKVDVTLETVLPSSENRPVSLNEAMRYSVFAGGKRLRPILCIAGCESVNGNPELALQPGAAIEMVHTYSLIHDDLPAMDNDDLRRGKPTCHKKFNEAMAILAGDALLTHAFGVVVCSPGIDSWLKNIIVAELSIAAGTDGMVAGQVVDMEKEGADFNADDVEYIHGRKTASMIAMSATLGTIIGNGSEEQVDAMRKYGHALGMCFQITDDILNVTGGKDLGKGVGTDKKRGKATVIAVHGMDESVKLSKKYRDEALEALSDFNHKADPLRALAKYIVERQN